jgi:hypothetical protein
METSAAKEAAIKRGAEKCLPTSRALPVCQPGGQEEVSDKGQGKEKSRNEKGEPDFEHGDEEETKDCEATLAVRSPGVRILRIDPRAPVFAGAILQFKGLHSKEKFVPQHPGSARFMRDSRFGPANRKFFEYGVPRFSVRPARRRLPRG